MLPVNDGEAGSFLKISRDGTEERLADQRQQLLTDELNHRVKNMLAMVQGIASQVLRTHSVEEARENLSLRLRALAVGHEVLTQEHWAGADLRQIATNALEPFRTAGDDRVRIGGPSFYLAPQPALALTMDLHELATNATKYGALSNETGRLDVSWTVDGDEAAVVRGCACSGRKREVRPLLNRKAGDLDRD